MLIPSIKTTKTQLLGSLPVDNSLNVAPDSNIILQFSAPVVLGSGYIIISNGQNDVRSIPVNDSLRIHILPNADNSGSNITINPNFDLFNDSNYFVQFADGVFKDQTGNDIVGINDTRTLNFKTAPPDQTPPIPVSSSPANQQLAVAVDSNITVSFNEPINLASGHFTLSNGQGDTREFYYEYSVNQSGYVYRGNDNSTLIIDPRQDLIANSEYFLQMDSGAVTDFAGNPVAAVQDPQALRFKTGAPETIPPIPISSFPLNGTEIPVNQTISAQFNETIQAGTGKITLSNGQGDTQIIDVKDSRHVVINGVDISVTPLKNLLPDSHYSVLVDPGALTDLNGNPIAGLQDANAFSFFTDTQAPQLTDHYLTGNNQALSLQFNENIQAGSGSIVISNNQGDSQRIAIHDNSQVMFSKTGVTITPKDSLLAGSQYFVQLDSGVIQDTSGHSLAATNVPFTLTPQPLDTIKPSPVSSTPVYGQQQAPLDSDIRITFNEPITLGTGHFVLSNGQGDTRTIAANDTSQVNHYYSGKSFDSTSININPKENLLANSHYYLTMEDNAILDMAGNAANAVLGNDALQFSTFDSQAPVLNYVSPVDDSVQVLTNTSITAQFNEPIKAGQGNIVISNNQGDTRTIAITDSTQVTLYRSEISVKPSQNLLPNSLYHVQFDKGVITDLASHPADGIYDDKQYNFLTAAADLTAPQFSYGLITQATSYQPVNSINLYFNEALRNGVGNIILSDGGNDFRSIAITDATQVAIYGNNLSITPTQALHTNSHYQVSIENGALSDLAGNAYTTKRTLPLFSFDTPLPDTTAPHLLTTNTTQLPINENIRLAFDETIKLGTGNILLSNSQGDNRLISLQDATQVSIESAVLVINPTQDLSPNSHYTLSFDPAALTDLANNSYSNNLSIDTLGKLPAIVTQNPVQEINHGGMLGIYDNLDQLVLHFDAAVQWHGGFKLNQHSFGGNDIVLSTDGLSASVELDSHSNVAHGDVLTLTGISDATGAYNVSLEFTL